jgi:hypothetical protein
LSGDRDPKFTPEACDKSVQLELAALVNCTLENDLTMKLDAIVKIRGLIKIEGNARYLLEEHYEKLIDKAII